MNISDRIQALRKSRGISQEQLADVLGVSRQAVSKWEAEQSSPDLERIVAMAEYFDVTTDYLLRGIEPAKEKKSRADSRTLCIVSTAVNAVGLIIGAALWRTYQNAFAPASCYGCSRRVKNRAGIGPRTCGCSACCPRTGWASLGAWRCTGSLWAASRGC